MNVLVTGGAGYIGSHTCVELLEAGHQVIVLDNLYNASEEALNRVREITGKPVKFYKGDIADAPLLEKIFEEDKPDVRRRNATFRSWTTSISLKSRFASRCATAGAWSLPPWKLTLQGMATRLLRKHWTA